MRPQRAAARAARAGALRPVSGRIGVPIASKRLYALSFVNEDVAPGATFDALTSVNAIAACPPG